jgi:hypothetical protein
MTEKASTLIIQPLEIRLRLQCGTCGAVLVIQAGMTKPQGVCSYCGAQWKAWQQPQPTHKAGHAINDLEAIEVLAGALALLVERHAAERGGAHMPFAISIEAPAPLEK